MNAKLLIGRRLQYTLLAHVSKWNAAKHSLLEQRERELEPRIADFFQSCGVKTKKIYRPWTIGEACSTRTQQCRVRIQNRNSPSLLLFCVRHLRPFSNRHSATPDARFSRNGKFKACKLKCDSIPLFCSCDPSIRVAQWLGRSAAETKDAGSNPGPSVCFSDRGENRKHPASKFRRSLKIRCCFRCFRCCFGA